MKIKIASRIGCLLTAIILAVIAIFTSHSAQAKVIDNDPNTDQRWIISEIYLGDRDGNGAYLELYNNDDHTALGWNDFLVNLPFSIDLPPIMDLRVYKPHSYKVIPFDENWTGWVAKQYIKVIYGDDLFHEIEDALDEFPNYSYQRCQSTLGNGDRVLSNKFYYGKKTNEKSISCSDSSVTDTHPDEVDDNSVCRKLKLNEIGSYMFDEDQFIEIKNTSNETINLSNCYLSTEQEKDKTFDNFIELDDYDLAPNGVYSFNVIDTDLPPLTKTTGIVYLLDSNARTVTDYKRYSQVKKDTTTALSPTDNKWYSTYTATPGEINVIDEYPACDDGYVRNPETHKCQKKLVAPDQTGGTDDRTDNSNSLAPCKEGYERNPTTNRCRKIYEDETEPTLTPCKAGYERNPETNRCRKITTGDTNNSSDDSSESSGLTPCKEGYYRNPETNRCKKITDSDNNDSDLVPCKEGYTRNPVTNRCVKIANTTSTLEPCKEGYERNPETNRCRKIASATDDLKPCKDGYERNPETNRCIKKSSADDDSDAKYPVETDSSVNNSDNTTSLIIVLVIIGVASLVILGWQFRHEIGRAFKKPKPANSKHSPSQDNQPEAGQLDDWINHLSSDDDSMTPPNKHDAKPATANDSKPN